MKPTVASLLVEAECAPPPEREAKSCWACYYPVVSKLVSNGRSVMQAVEWLISKKAIPASKKTNAYRALRALHVRRTK